MKIDCLLSVLLLDILKTTKIIENFAEISRIFSRFINFWRFFFALRNPQWFPDARSHLEVKIIAKKPANLVDFFQKFTEIDCLLSVNPLDILKTTKNYNLLKNLCDFEKNILFSVNPLHILTPARPKITARNQKKIENWLPFECASIGYPENSKNLKLLKKV